MKIQFGEKGEVSWDVLLETLEAQQQQQQRSKASCTERLKQQCCGGSWLTVAFVVCVVTISQVGIFLYFLSSVSTGPITHLVYTDVHGKLRHVHFSWSNCGRSTDPVQLKQLQVTPDPVMINGNITLNLNANLDLNLDSPISASVKVERRVGWMWVTIPCLEGLGSCHYRDVCQLSPIVPPTPCPDPFPRFGLPCRCPVAKGRYRVREGVFSIPGLSRYIPAWLVSGDYYIHGTAQKDGHTLGCYNLYISISH